MSSYTKKHNIPKHFLYSYLLALVFEGSSRYSDSETESRSPSPSSGVETNSFKDSPMQIDVMGLDQGFGKLIQQFSLNRNKNCSFTIRWC